MVLALGAGVLNGVHMFKNALAEDAYVFNNSTNVVYSCIRIFYLIHAISIAFQ
jgi:hypothetical protein